MDVFPTGDLFWMLILTVPVLVVLLVLCIDCRDTELDTPPIGDYEDKPPTTSRPQTFRVLRRPPSPPWFTIQSQPDLSRCPPYSFANQSTSMKNEADNVPPFHVFLSFQKVCPVMKTKNHLMMKKTMSLGTSWCFLMFRLQIREMRITLPRIPLWISTRICQNLSGVQLVNTSMY
ncbi:linker for activation of T-cells family member 1 isoform X4 [Anolis sagrei]|uniref:linker for activation of T-cells family member 1 isoform X4 n=1 Tax=Anolis sagrei TaxID=38937 RepID=UPI0035219EDD